jgi:multidrug efflux pump subunit AcrA (membrane-fusion protein)
VQVPQTDAPAIHAGTTATLTVPEYPNQQFSARVVASADSVSSGSGTTLVQLLVDNSNSKLMPGGFASLNFTLPVAADSLRVPASALVFDGRGVSLATLGENSHVLFKKVKIDRDFGDSVEIGSGISANDRVIDTPPDGLVDGESVQVAVTDKKAAAHG